jgi:hypothetical protein
MYEEISNVESVERIALLASNEVFWIFNLQDNMPHKSRYVNGLLNNPVFVEATNLPGVAVGSLYDNENFYDLTDQEKTNPLQIGDPLLSEDGSILHKMAAISNGSVFGIIWLANDLPNHLMRKAGLLSNPVAIDITVLPEVEVGWTWDGKLFVAPPNNESS